jgi:hypothetical protein
VAGCGKPGQVNEKGELLTGGVGFAEGFIGMTLEAGAIFDFG